ncbi:hypothetical protein TrRE_jg5509 [Triparma retinervis]|uniref:Kinesin motor domain-containing protein n=1 Tax=Triparma retinervis TaxID=2557542 RepID=A0A9W6ZIF4_9STRA|nr:hypothetical protein TrRE_jg5509 [Triparma retinervis]
MSEAIKVCVRVRPQPGSHPPYHPQSTTSLGAETFGCIATLSSDKTTLSLTGPSVTDRRKNRDEDRPSQPQQLKTYAFDNILPPPSTNEDLYKEAAASVVTAVNKYNQDGTVFFYGQTGAGKSWSCFGDILTTKDLSSMTANDGVMTRALRDLYSPESQPGLNHAVHREVTFFEIFNERVHDLLSPPPPLHKSMPSLPVRTHPTKGSYIEGITSLPVADLTSCLKLVRKGYARRAVAGTKMNDQSSRSHAVVRVKTVIKDMEHEKSTPIVTHLTFVDLAGSERQRDTGNTGERLKEASSINKSLSTLGGVIFALGVNCLNPTETRHVPFRDSKLTLLLRTSLNPANCRTVMVMNVSPDEQQFMETVSTLKFAQRVKQIKTKDGVDDKFKAEESGEVDALRKEIGRLKMKLDGVNTAPPAPSQTSTATTAYLQSTIPKMERMEALTRTLVPNYHRRIMEDKLIDRLKTEKISRLQRLLRAGDSKDDDPDSDLNVLCSEIDSLRRLLNEPDPDAVMYKAMYDDLLESKEPLFEGGGGDEINNLRNLTTALMEEKQSLNSELEGAKKEASEAQSKAQDSTAATKKLLERRLKEAEERAEAAEEAATQKKEVAKLAASLNATQVELREKSKDFSKMQRDHEAEMDSLTNELFMESERMTEEKGATEIEMKGKLAAAFKDNAILQQRVKSLTSEREKYEKEISTSNSKIAQLEGEIEEIKASAAEQKEQIAATHKVRVEKLEQDNLAAYENSEKWERAAEENERKAGSLIDEVKRLKKKRDDDAFELENLQEDMDTMTENVKFLQLQNEELQTYNVRLEELNNLGNDNREDGEEVSEVDGELCLTEERAKQILEEAVSAAENDAFNESAFLPPPDSGEEAHDVFNEDFDEEDDEMFFESQPVDLSRDDENEGIPTFRTPQTTGKAKTLGRSSSRKALAMHNE